jgi:hypothetical protein
MRAVRAPARLGAQSREEAAVVREDDNGRPIYPTLLAV